MCVHLCVCVLTRVHVCVYINLCYVNTYNIVCVHVCICIILNGIGGGGGGCGEGGGRGGGKGGLFIMNLRPQSANGYNMHNGH